MFSSAETVACRRLIELALEEDLGAVGDLTCQAVIPVNLAGKAVFVARSQGVIAGLPAAELVFTSLASETTPGRVRFSAQVADGSGPLDICVVTIAEEHGSLQAAGSS